MKRISIYASLEYVAGHLRSGHKEGIINLTDEEFEEFKTNPKKFIYDNDVELTLFIDDWEINDCGEISNVHWSECEPIKFETL